MSHPQDFESRLAGLDTMVVHFNHDRSCPSPTVSAASTALDGISYVRVPRSRKRDVSRRRGSRSPFADKSHDINVNSPNPASDSNPSPLISWDSIKESRQSPKSRLKPYRASTSFHPLPAVPSASSLQLPSFLDFSFHSFTHSPEPVPQPSPPVLPSMTPLPLPNLSQLIFPKDEETRNAENKHEPIEIPAFSHPNSPYVPWDLPVRREILCPISPASRISAFSSCYSRPYSRSGARAPEPMDIQEHDSRCTGDKFLKVSKSWKNLRRVFKRNIKYVTKRFTSPKKPFQPAHASDGAEPFYDITLERDIFDDYPLHRPSFPSPTAASFDSSNTTSLATWLATRQPEGREDDCDPHCIMTLDEYEQRGSWTDLSNAEQDPNLLWGVAACQMLSQYLSVSTEDQTTSTENSGSVLWPLQHSHTPSRRSPTSAQPLPFPPFSAYSSRSGSLSRMARGGTASLPGMTYQGHLSPGMLAKREREMSMPGGWTFGS